MKFTDAIDDFIRDMRSQSRITSDPSERAYRGTLVKHAEDLGNQDPRYAHRDAVKKTLARWPHPNTQRKCRAQLVSFYDWTMEEGIRKDNPARQTRRPKARAPRIYRMTREEAAAFLAAADTVREKRIAHLGVCAGIRNAELRGLQGRHFQRPGFVYISPDIGKGGRQRWIPVLEELAPVVDQIVATVAADEYVVPAQRWRDGFEKHQGRKDLTRNPCSSQALRTAVMNIAKRAGIAAHVHPHLMRHAFGDHVARYAGMRNAQALLGHADVGTTQAYTGAPTLDELTRSIGGFRFAATTAGSEHTFNPPVGQATNPGEARTGVEPVVASSSLVEPDPADLPPGGLLWHDES